MFKLFKGIEASYNDRINFIGKNINETHKMLHRFHTDHHTMAKNLQTTLEDFTGNLADYVDHLLGRFKRERMALHRELQPGRRAFAEGTKNMARTRKNFSSDVEKETKKSGQKKH
jgi:hypothetical protein